MILLLVIINGIFIICTYNEKDKPYHGYLNELTILNYNNESLSQNYTRFIQKYSFNKEETFEFKINTPLKTFHFCLRVKPDEPIYELIAVYYFTGILCYEQKTHAYGYIENGVFYGKVDYEHNNNNGSTEQYVFSDLSYVKDLKQKQKGHSILYKNTHLDHDFLQKNIKRESIHPQKHMLRKILKNNTLFRIHAKNTQADDGKGLNKHQIFNDSFIRLSTVDNENTESNEEQPQQPIVFNNTCETHVDIHPSYIQDKNSLKSAVLEIIVMYEMVNKLLRNNFQTNSGEPLLQYKVSSFRVLDGSELSKINSFIQSPNKTLHVYNNNPLYDNGYCSRLLLVSYDWEGTLGTAYIGTPIGTGICGSLSGIVVSSNLYGKSVDILTMEQTIIHEYGHTMGVNHDPILPCTENKCPSLQEVRECSPGGLGGMFIMCSTTNSGALPNNRLFSPCSKKKIFELIRHHSRTHCLKSGKKGVCGNGIIEDDEVCDSGVEEDKCCTKSTRGRSSGCFLKLGAKCSPTMGLCCEANCEFSSRHSTCSMEHDCAKPNKCSGVSAICPNLNNIPRNTPCNHDKQACNGEGVCNLSLCSVENKVECDCPNKELQCAICCKSLDGTSECEPLKYGSRDITYKSKGDTCDNNKGICRVNHKCVTLVVDASYPMLWKMIINGTTEGFYEVVLVTFNRNTEKILEKLYEAEKSSYDVIARDVNPKIESIEMNLFEDSGSELRPKFDGETFSGANGSMQSMLKIGTVDYSRRKQSHISIYNAFICQSEPQVDEEDHTEQTDNLEMEILKTIDFLGSESVANEYSNSTTLRVTNVPSSGNRSITRGRRSRSSCYNTYNNINISPECSSNAKSSKTCGKSDNSDQDLTETQDPQS